MKSFLRLLALIFLLPAYGFAAVDYPAGEPIYGLLDRLEAYNCAYSTNRVLGPQSHEDLVSTVFVSEENDRCEAPEWLLKERQILTRPVYPLKIENRSVIAPVDFLTFPGTAATITPLLPGREGRRTLPGFTSGTELQLHTGTRAAKVAVSAGLRPGWVGMLPHGYPVQGALYLQEAYLKFGYGWSEFSWGRTALRFGDTKHGSLLFSQAAAPIDMLKYSLRPVVPGFASFLGPVSAQVFWGYNDTATSGANLLGLQLSLRPKHWLEIGWTELFQFGAGGAPQLSLGDILSMSLYLDTARLRAARTRMMATHLGVWLFQRKAKLYFQTLFSDGNNFDGFNYMVGLRIPRIGNSELRVEWAQTGRAPYQQTLFANGLAYKGSPLGHPLGPAAQGLYVDWDFLLWDDWRVEVGGSLEQRGRNLPGKAMETRYGASLRARKRWWSIDLEAGATYQHSQNTDYQPGITADSILGDVRFVYSFL